MTPILLIAGLAVLTVMATVLVDRWARREPPFADTQDDPRIIDIVKRGEVCPWRQAE